MPLLKRVRTIAAKVETTPGTAESLTASEGAFNAYDIEINAAIEVEQREGQASFDYLSGVAGQRMGTMTFSTDLGWDGTVTMPTWASVLLPGCGVVESSQVYTPRSEAPGSNVKTLTLGVYENGLLKTLAGAVGNFRIVLPTGRMARMEFEFQGVWQAPTDTSIIAPTYPTALPLRFASAAAVTYDSVDLKIESMTWDAGNQIKMIEDATTASGLCYGIVTDRQTRITANPESELVATRPDYADWIGDVEAALAVTLDGPSDSTIALSAPKAQIINVQEGDRDGLQIDDIEWAANKNGANLDENFSITFSEAS